MFARGAGESRGFRPGRREIIPSLVLRGRVGPMSGYLANCTPDYAAHHEEFRRLQILLYRDFETCQ